LEILFAATPPLRLLLLVSRVLLPRHSTRRQCASAAGFESPGTFSAGPLLPLPSPTGRSHFPVTGLGGSFIIPVVVDGFFRKRLREPILQIKTARNPLESTNTDPLRTSQPVLGASYGSQFAKWLAQFSAGPLLPLPSPTGRSHFPVTGLGGPFIIPVVVDGFFRKWLREPILQLDCLKPSRIDKYRPFTQLVSQHWVPVMAPTELKGKPSRASHLANWEP